MVSARFRTFHVGRRWAGHEVEDGCPCPQAPCGFVVQDDVDPQCPEHPWSLGKSMRQGHPADECPGGPA